MKDIEGYKVGSSAELLEWLEHQGFNPLKQAVFNIDDVPHMLRPLAPLAEQWGIPDDIMRDRAIHCATHAEWSELVERVLPLNDFFDAWLAAPGADFHNAAYTVFTCLRMSAEYAEILLEQNSLL